jgi:hypothetical protein
MRDIADTETAGNCPFAGAFIKENGGHRARRKPKA